MSPFDASPSHLAPLDVLLRLSLAILFAGILGLDREFKGTDAGLRTHCMTALAACVFTVLTLEIRANIPEYADPLRIIDAVTAGVAFLAAGAIIRSEGAVRGLTTGAGIWLAGAVGVACGAGYFTLAGMASFLAIVVYRGLRVITRAVPHDDERRSGD